MRQATAKKRHPIRQEPPLKLPGFENIRHTWDSVHHCYSARILPGEYYVSRSEEVIVTVLGSCVSACIRDRKYSIGGMNHFMLPNDNGSIGRGDACVSTAARYGSFAMEHMINDIITHGGRRENLEIKLFGVGRIMQSNIDVGENNIAFVRHYLQDEGLQVMSEDLGGDHPRKVLYFPHSGRVLVRRMPLERRGNNQILQQEQQYQNTLQQAPVSGEIDLF